MEQVARVAAMIRRRSFEMAVEHNGGYLIQACSSAEMDRSRGDRREPPHPWGARHRCCRSHRRALSREARRQQADQEAL
jgi:hypothetical protein